MTTPLKPWHESKACLTRKDNNYAICILCRTHKGFSESFKDIGKPRDAICPEGFALDFIPQIAIRLAGKPRPVPPMPKLNLRQPGDLVAHIIHKLTGVQPCAKCEARRLHMNQLGWWGCYKHRFEIIKMMVHEAKLRGIKVEEETAMGLLIAGLREAAIQQAKEKAKETVKK